MLHYNVNSTFWDKFWDNLANWCKGGPLECGWTRSGPAVSLSGAPRLVFLERTMLTPDQILEKNPNETRRWHLDFLADPLSPHYYLEYLLPRMNAEDSEYRALRFLELFESIREHGIQKPVWVADVSSLNLGLTYFRFDGCHRTCCAKALGIEQVPTLLFKACLD